MSGIGIRGPRSAFRHWSAWLPLAISIFLISLALRYVAIHGQTRVVDEGSEAHLFQLLVPLQALVIAYFALTWLPRTPRMAAGMLGLQLVAVGVVLAVVYWLEHG